MLEQKKNNCYSCAYRRNIPGDAHSQCVFNWREHATHSLPRGNPHGVNSGWFMFPINYDPVWMIDECGEFSETADDSKISKNDPLLALLSMLR